MVVNIKKKKKICPLVRTSIIQWLKEMSYKHNLSQNKIIERALRKELKELEILEPII